MTPSTKQPSFPKWPFQRRTPPPSVSRWAAGTLFLVVLSIFLAFILEEDAGPRFPEYSIGDIAQADVVVPTDLVFKDEPSSEAARVSAVEKVLPVYRYWPEKNIERAMTLAVTFQQCRAMLQASQEIKSRPARFSRLTAPLQAALLEKLTAIMVMPIASELIDYLFSEGFDESLEKRLASALNRSATLLIVEDHKALVSGKSQLRTVESSGKESSHSFDEVLTWQQALQRLEAWMASSSDSAERSRLVAEHLLTRLLQPNLSFDLQSTEAKQAEAAASADPVLRQLKKGKVLLRQGDEIQADHLIQIDALRKASQKASSLRRISGLVALLAAVLGMCGYFLRLLPQQQWSHPKLAVLLGAVLAGNLTLLKVVWFFCGAISSKFLASPFNESSYFFFVLPFAFGAMLITLLAGERVALLFLLFFYSMAGLAVRTDIHGLFYILTANLLGILAVTKASQRVGIVLSGFRLGLAATLLFILIHMSRDVPLGWSAGAFGSVLAFLSGPITAGLLVFALPLCEQLFSVTTEIRLSELGNVNLPLLRQLILKAPGTYNHSIAVGTLSEGAAKAIGLNPLFARVACLYHDVGKSPQPEYFIENQQGANPHDVLSPEESVRIVTSHVSEGIRLAREAGLPPAIVEIIPQHHGTKLLTPFYAKARALANGDESKVPEERFRYNGPKPQTKEAAIIMLADGVEAAARTLKDRSQERLLELIRRIVSGASQDGQFSDCEITLADLERITFSFLETLSRFYHGRITYPGFEFGEKRIPVASAKR
jgi:cyclic-di-AMP phosphodiesterase PgpH